MRYPRFLATCLVLGLAASCAPPVPAPSGNPDRITQASVINALMIGRYDGVNTIAEMLEHGDFGLGTLDHLDGELIILDGRAYQVRGDGAVVPVGPEWTTPFAVVTPFDEDGSFACPQVAGLTALESRLDEALPQRNSFVAVRIEGRFASLKLRSVHRQEPPYRPLGEVAESQSVWTREGLSGTVLGIRSPAWVGGLTVPGWHWHFLSDDRKVGGHVLDARPTEGRVRYDLCHDWEVLLPRSREFDQADLTPNLSRELKRVESARDPAPPRGPEGR
ncbi:acetolactate decarboxylase [Paludisphaera mucosa]|uniref:Alpha-acetolactate decarboxylase n=1 Tax=Paludisphaera mucosa TaxID=3030827 RepID=A0ABT6FH43_9BACT|nr:acetolactate decarboxylase [Paludisphaera mucosa]MDG3006844.1 acetolactate decarboxylase [Paludisphaera mucosa]